MNRIPSAGAGLALGATLLVAACGQGVTPSWKRAFVTSATHSGSLEGIGGADGGLAGGDKLCLQAAAAAQLGGVWRVWLSSRRGPDSETINAIDRIADVGPWHLVTADGSRGTRVFNNKANLGTTPLAAFTTTEQGSALPAGETVWTGTRAGGLANVQSNCLGWTVARPNAGVYGEPFSTTGMWTEAPDVERGCETLRHFYCFEQ